MKIKPLKKKGLGRLFRRPRPSDILRDIDEVHKWPTDSSMTIKPIFKPMFEPPRRCEVDGKPAVFHRWVDEDKVLLHFDTLQTWQKHRARLVEFKKDGLVYPDCHTEAVRQTFALVEYDDGTVGKVEPEKVKFTDRRPTNDQSTTKSL